METAIKNWHLAAVCALCRVLRAVLRVLGCGGTSLPGRLALRLCPDILARLSEGMNSVLVTGTNGKTTTCALLRRMAQTQGIAYVANTDGANLIYGIASAFACQRLGKARPKLAIIECDELNLPRAARALQPKCIVVTNLFRDQLDRYGELTHTRAALLKGIENAPDATLCLNADCSLTATLALEAPNTALFFGLNLNTAPQTRLSDAPRCLNCGGEYAYTNHTFAHLGDWYCPTCGRKRPAPDVAIVSETRGKVGAEVFGAALTFRAALESDYNLYNTAAALTAAGALGWDTETAAFSLADAAAPFGRGETLHMGKTEVRLYLSKNPAGMDRLLERLSDSPELLNSVFCLNDNFADGRDVSWIWDCDLESFVLKSGISRAAVWGTRRQDMRLRLNYASEEKNRLHISELRSLRALKHCIASSPVPVCIIANYTAMLAVRRALSGRSIGRATWS